MTDSLSLISLLLQQEDLQTQIDSVGSKIAALHQSMEGCQSQVDAYEQDRKRLDYLRWELDKALVKAICPTDEVLRRLFWVVGSLRNHDHPQLGARAIDQRFAALGFAQSSLDG